MSRRKHSHDEELPFVALMDTMTNVVGVLIIVLVMMAISLANAVKKVMTDLVPVTEEQVEKTRREVEETKARVHGMSEAVTKAEDSVSRQARLDSLGKEVEQLGREAREKISPMADLEPMRRQVEALDGELRAKSAEAEGEKKRLEDLKVVVANLPEAKPPPDIPIRLPDSRAIPKDAKKDYFTVSALGVYHADPEEAKQVFLDEMNSPAGRRLEKQGPRKANEPRVLYDHAAMINYFAGKKLRSATFDITVNLEKGRVHPGITASVRPDAIESLQQALSFSSKYRNALRKVRAYPDKVVVFTVSADGYENYLALRDIADSDKIPAGWDFAGDGLVRIPDIMEITMNSLEAPPPPSQAPPPPPAPKPNPNAPKPLGAPTLKID